MNTNNLTIVGTSHIAKQSMKEVQIAIMKSDPDIVALELDRKRFYALQNQKKTKISLLDIKRIGMKGFFFAVIASYIQKKLGNLVGVSPGSEMLTAIKFSKKMKKKIALIDQDIDVTLRKLSQAITWKEKWNFIVDIFKGIFMGKKEMAKIGIKKIDLTKVPSRRVIKKLIQRVKERYPSLHFVLIEERNMIMAKKLEALMQKHPEKKILAVVGAGHEEDILNLIKTEQEIKYSFSVG